MRASGQYWVKVKWPTAVNRYIWTVASFTSANGGKWFFVGQKSDDQILEIDENKLVYSPPRQKEYTWPTSDDFSSVHVYKNAKAVCQSLKNIGEILQDIHQQLVISNQKR